MPKSGFQPQVGLELRKCANSDCATEFQPYRDHQIACSRPCRDKTKDLSPRRGLYVLWCKDCGDRFTVQWTGMGRQPSCAICTQRKARIRQDRKNASKRLENSGAVGRERNRRFNLLRYGITKDDYDQMLEKQSGRCAICGDPPSPNGRGAASRLHVDHDHDTGRVRGLLCCNCNPGLGYFKNDISRLLGAIEYLKEC